MIIINALTSASPFLSQQFRSANALFSHRPQCAHVAVGEQATASQHRGIAATMASARELVRKLKSGEKLNGMEVTPELREMYEGREQLLVTCVRWFFATCAT